MRFFAILIVFSFTLGGVSPLTAFSVARQHPSTKTPATIVMFGDSITKGGKWEELLNRSNIYNEGVKNRKLIAMVNDLDSVYRHNPKIVFIMGGINDIAGGISVYKIFEKYKIIVERLQSRNIIPVIQATLYTRQKKAWFNPDVTRLNQMLYRYAKNNRIEYINLNRRLSWKSTLIQDYTSDGLHLRENAYVVWGRHINRVLNKHERLSQ